MTVYKGGLEDADAASAALKGCDVIYHLAAARTGSCAILFAHNVIAFRTFIKKISSSEIRRFVLVSSLGVYGTAHLRPGDLLDETQSLDPEPHCRDPYTYSKIAQEQVAWDAYNDGKLPLVVVRPGTIYGPGRDCLTTRNGLRVGPLLVRMGGKHIPPYTFVDNCAAAVMLAGLVPGIEGEVFNVVDDNLLSSRDVLRRYKGAVASLRIMPVPQWAVANLARLCEWYGKRCPGMLPAVLTHYNMMALWKPLRYTNAKAKRILGWQASVGFRDGLERTLASLTGVKAESRGS
jgi:nucleoside-diphosphate-sugar epimerase